MAGIVIIIFFYKRRTKLTEKNNNFKRKTTRRKPPTSDGVLNCEHLSIVYQNDRKQTVLLTVLGMALCWSRGKLPIWIAKFYDVPALTEEWKSSKNI